MTNLGNKKALAARTLNVGKNRIHFNNTNSAELKEAITKQDIRDLYSQGIIKIKPIGGRRTIKKRKTIRGPGKIRKTVGRRKQIYVKITRKLRAYLKELKRIGIIDKDLYSDLRKKIRMRAFKSKAHLKEYLKDFKEEIKSSPKIKQKAEKEKITEKKLPKKVKIGNKEKIKEKEK
jgi:large subunit ribosomal protein L19e